MYRFQTTTVLSIARTSLATLLECCQVRKTWIKISVYWCDNGIIGEWILALFLCFLSKLLVITLDLSYMSNLKSYLHNRMFALCKPKITWILIKYLKIVRAMAQWIFRASISEFNFEQCIVSIVLVSILNKKLTFHQIFTNETFHCHFLFTSNAICLKVLHFLAFYRCYFLSLLTINGDKA